MTKSPQKENSICISLSSLHLLDFNDQAEVCFTNSGQHKAASGPFCPRIESQLQSFFLTKMTDVTGLMHSTLLRESGQCKISEIVY